MLNSWRRTKMRWLWNKFWNEHTPPCMACGWNMKVWKDSMFNMEWKCVWNGCGWGSFQDANGKLHWLKN